MRYRSTKPALFIIIVLCGALGLVVRPSRFLKARSGLQNPEGVG